MLATPIGSRVITGAVFRDMPDELENYLNPSPSPRIRVHSIASRIGIDPAIADDYLRVTNIESGHNVNVRDSAKGAQGFGQVMPDSRGGSTRTISGRRYNLRNPDENIEAGLKLFSAGGSDPVGRRLEYFGGAGARRRYERTGRIPNISDGNLTASQYVLATQGQQQPLQPKSDLDSYLDPVSGQTPPITPKSKTQTIPQTSPETSTTPSVPIEEALAKVASQANQIAPRIQHKFGIRSQTNVPALMQQFGRDRTIQESARQDEEATREAVRQERRARIGPYGNPTAAGALHLIANPIQDITGLFRSEEENVNRETAERLKQQQVMQEPEVTDIRKEYGQMSAPVRSVVAPVVGRGGSGLLKTAAGIASAFGIAPNRLSDWANKRAEIIEAGSTATPLREKRDLSSLIAGDVKLEEVERGVPEKIATGFADLGVGIGQIILLQKATGLPMPQLLALEGAAKANNQPIEKQLTAAGEGYALGTALNKHLSRGANAALFGVPTAAQTGYEVSQGRMSPLDAAIQTGIQAGAGAGLTPSAASRRRGQVAARVEGLKPEFAEPSTETFTPVRRGGLQERIAPRAESVAPPSFIEKNRDVLESPAFREAVLGESVSGNAGTGRAAVNAVIDKDGKIVRLGNIQDFPEDLQAKIRAGKYDQVAILVKDATSNKPEIERIVPHPRESASGEPRNIEPRWSVDFEQGTSKGEVPQEIANIQARAAERRKPVVRDWSYFKSQGMSNAEATRALREEARNATQSQAQPPVETQRAEAEPANGQALPEVVRTDGSALAELATAEAQTSRRWLHSDFGEVTESPRQNRVGKGRVRVIAEDGTEHIIKRANLSGIGNARAIPVKEKPVEPDIEQYLEPSQPAPSPAEAQPATPSPREAGSAAVPVVELGSGKKYVERQGDWFEEGGSGVPVRDRDLINQIEVQQFASSRNPSAQSARSVTEGSVSTPAEIGEGAGKSLSQFVRKNGGIVPAEMYRGELDRLRTRETGTTGLINRHARQGNVKQTADIMMQMANDAGFRKPDGQPFDNPGDFLRAVERDVAGEKTRTVRGDEPNWEEALRKHEHGQQADIDAVNREADARVTLLENEQSGMLYDKIVEGKANESDLQQFRQYAKDAGLSESGAEDLIASARPSSVEAPATVQTTARPSEQLGFVEEGLRQQEAPRGRISDQRERLLAEQQSRQEAENPERTSALHTLEEIRRRGMTVDDYARQGALFGESPSPETIQMLRDLEKGTPEPLPSAQPSLLESKPPKSKEVMPVSQQTQESQERDVLDSSEVLYHGTPRGDIQSLQSSEHTGYFGRGIYLTREPEVAQRFTRLSDLSPTMEAQGGGKYQDINTGRVVNTEPKVLRVQHSNLRLKRITPSEFEAMEESFRRPDGRIDLDRARASIQAKYEKEGYDGLDIPAERMKAATGDYDFNEPQIVVFPKAAPKLKIDSKPPESTTAAKKASFSADRAELDLPELPDAQRKAWQTTLDNAKSKGLDRKAETLADEVLNRPRGLNDEETAGLVLRAQELKNEHARVTKEIEAATDPAEIQAKSAEQKAIENAFEKVSAATKQSGTENARALAAHKLTINQDFDLVSVVAGLKAAKGRELTPAERSQAESWVKEKEQLESRIAELEANQNIDSEIKQTRSRRRSTTKSSIDAEWADLQKQFAELKSDKGVGAFFKSEKGELDPEAIRLIGRMARNRIQAGVNTAQELVREVYETVKRIGVDTSEREVRDAISGYGVTSSPSQDAAAKRLREVKQLLRDMSAVEDIQEGERPLRSGLQRDKPSQEVRESRRRVLDELRKHPEIERAMRDPAQQQKTLLDSAKTRLRNRIEDLTRLIAEHRKESKAPSRLVPDSEMVKLRQERDQLQKLYDEIPDPSADQKAIDRSLAAVEKSIAAMEQQLSSGDLSANRPTQSPWSEELGRAKARQGELRKQISDARRATNRGTADEQYRQQLQRELDRVDKDISDLQTRIASGDVASKVREGAQSVWSQELGEARRERASLRAQLGEMRAGTPEAQQRAVRQKLEAAERSVTDLERRVRENDLSTRARGGGPSSPELEATRTQQKALRSILNDLRQAAKPKLSEVELAARKQLATERAVQTRLGKQIVDLEGQLRTGNFTERPQREPPRYTRETYQLQKRLDEIRGEYERAKYRAQRGRLGMLADTVIGTGNVPKTLLSMGDLSAMLRQGGIGFVQHPILSSRAAVDMLHSFTAHGFANVENAIKSHPDFELAKRSGLEFTGVDQKDPRLSHREEGYLGSDVIDTLARQPVVGTAVKPLKFVKDVSERTFVSFLDSQRMRIFSEQANRLRDMSLTPKELNEALKATAQYTNIITGRGSLGRRGNQAAPLLNMAMFSPRLVASRVQFLNKMFNPVAWANMPKGARELQLKDNAKFLVATAGTLALANAASLALTGHSAVGLDPDDADFLKIRAGNTRYDVLTGLQQPMRFFFRMAMAIKGGETYSGDTKSKILGDFTRSKAAPGAGLAWDYLEGKNRLSGKKFEGKDVITGGLIPLPVKDISEAVKQDGALRGTIEALPSLLGVGVQTYKDSAEKPHTPAEKLARRFGQRKMGDDEGRTQEQIDTDTQKTALRARSRSGEDVSADVAALGPKITPQQAKRILGARNKTRLQEDVNGLGPAEAILVWQVATPQQREELKDIIQRKAALIDLRPPDEQPALRQKFSEFGIPMGTRRLSRPSRESRPSRSER